MADASDTVFGAASRTIVSVQRLKPLQYISGGIASSNPIPILRSRKRDSVDSSRALRARCGEQQHHCTLPGVALQALEDGGGISRYAIDGTGNWYGGAASYLDVMSNPFGPGAAGNGTISAFIAYDPGTFTTARFGHTSAAEPLKGLAPNYMRGSKFHVQTNDEAAGDYWIMLQSGDTAGVVRSYGDGTANWRGHPDTFYGGADDTLEGNDATGTVTLSVYAEYEEFHPQ